MGNRVLVAFFFFFFFPKEESVKHLEGKTNQTKPELRTWNSTTETTHRAPHENELHISTIIMRVTGWGLTLPATELLGQKCVKSL